MQHGGWRRGLGYAAAVITTAWIVTTGGASIADDRLLWEYETGG